MQVWVGRFCKGCKDQEQKPRSILLVLVGFLWLAALPDANPFTECTGVFYVAPAWALFCVKYQMTIEAIISQLTLVCGSHARTNGRQLTQRLLLIFGILKFPSCIWNLVFPGEASIIRRRFFSMLNICRVIIKGVCRKVT